MKCFGLVLLIAVLFAGCGGGGGGAGGSAKGEPTAKLQSQQTVYTIEVSGNGVTFSADMHAYPQLNGVGNQVETDVVMQLLGAETRTYNLVGESMIMNVALNNGAGVLNIVTKKNGVALRNDQINANGASISISDGF